MQVTQTSADGLKRELKVVVGAVELGERFVARLDELKDTIQLKGFRPGKVPVSHLRKVYGRSVMAEVLEKTVEESSRKALTDRNERPAMQPEIKLAEDKDEIERVLAGSGDLAYTITFEVLPEIKLTDFGDLKLEREVAEVSTEDVDKAVGALVERSISYDVDVDRAAATGDRLTIDFLGRIDGAEFEGGKATDTYVVLGQGGFIPGFEDGLAGSNAGEERLVKATFPSDYTVATLAGKEATFEVKVKEVAKGTRPEVNDEFAKTLGAEDLDKLKEMVTQQIRREFDQIARAKLKRGLLDQLDKSHDLMLPPSLVNAEFEAVWKQLTDGMQQAKRTFADEAKTEDEVKAEYRRLAERRVRLGLVLGEIGEKNKIQVSQEELRRALIEQARRYPGQEKFVYEFYEKNPGALQQLRAPIFEDKIVDYVVELAKPTEKKVTREELMKQPDDDAAV